jgi:fibronectin type 3 domain-containing protein
MKMKKTGHRAGIVLLAALLCAGCANPAGDQTTSVNAVTVSPPVETIPRGGNRVFSAEVTGDNIHDQTVTWQVAGNSSELTAFDAEGKLSVAEEETAETLSVIATSTLDSAGKGYATVTVVPKGAGSKPAAIAAAPQVTPRGSAGLAVSWEAVEGALSYEVYAGTTPESAVKIGGDVVGTSLDIANLSPATVYYVRVRAKNDAGAGPFSPVSAAVSAEAAPENEDPGPEEGTGEPGNGTRPPETPEEPGAPPAAIAAAPLAQPDGFNRIAVSWTAAEGALSYEVYAGSSPETAVKTGGDVAGTGVVLSGLADSAAYYVKVRAKNAAGTGPFSPPSAAVRTSDAFPAGFLAAEDHWGSGVGDGYKIDASGRIQYLGVENVTEEYEGAYSFVANIKYHVQFPQETISSRGGEQVAGASGVFIIEYADPLPTPGGLTLPGRFQAIYYWGLGTNHPGTAYPANAAKGLPQVFMANSANLAATSPEFANNGEDPSTGVNPETQTLSQAIAKFTLAKRNLWVAYGVVYPQMKDFAILY